MLSASSAEKNSYPQFFHSLYSAVLVNFAQIELFWRRLSRQSLPLSEVEGRNPERSRGICSLPFVLPSFVLW